MTDDRFEQDLRAELRSQAPVDVPVSLALRVASARAASRTPRRRTLEMGRGLFAAAAVAAAVLVAVGALLSGAVRVGPVTGPGTPTATASPSPGASVPVSVGGPLISDAQPGGSIGLGLDSIEPGVPFSWGNTRLYDPSDTAVVIDGVELMGASPGLRVLAMGGLPSAAPFGGGTDFSRQPVPSDLEAAIGTFPLVGATVLPGTSPGGARWTSAVFILSTPATGDYTVDSLRIHYHVGNRHYQTVIASGLDVCVGASYSDTTGLSPSCPTASPAPTGSASPGAGR